MSELRTTTVLKLGRQSKMERFKPRLFTDGRLYNTRMDPPSLRSAAHPTVEQADLGGTRR